MSIYHRIEDTIGGTPLLRLNRMNGAQNAEVLVKLEYFNPGSSIKDRAALSMIQEAERAGVLKPGGTIIEPTSGNTGIGLAMIAAARGYKIQIVMPETMSKERRMLISHFGAELVLTPGVLGMSGAIAKAEELLNATPNSFMPSQFMNPANPNAHYRTTGPELWTDSDGRIDLFTAGVGTGGTLCGAGKYLKEKNSSLRLVALEPEKSPVLSGGKGGPHAIQGIGAGFVPGNYDSSLVDEVIVVPDEAAIECAKEAARLEGVLCGISGGANLYGALTLARRPENAGKVIATVLPDTGERYLSTVLFA